MKKRNQTWFRQICFLCTPLWLVILTACQPAGAPVPEVVSEVETVIVTEVVEGEAGAAVDITTPAQEVMEEPLEVKPTSQPPPTQAPLGTLTHGTVEPLPSSLDIEDRRIEVEWPVAMAISESATVRLSFVPTGAGFDILTEFPEQNLTVTEVAVKQFAGYELTAVANLDGVGFTISPPGEQIRLVTEGEPLVWYWTISPLQSGEQRLSLSLRLHWKTFDGTGRAREAVLYSKALRVTVETVSESVGETGPLAMVCLFAGIALSMILLGARLVGRRRRSQSGDVSPLPATRFISQSGVRRGADTPLSPSSPIAIEPPAGMDLSPLETRLLSTLFSRYSRLVIEREFLSGYSGARTFLAVPIRSDGRTDAHTIVKISSARSAQREYENYENYVKTTLPPATARIQQPPVQEGGLAALQYTFLGGPNYNPNSLRQTLLRDPDPRLLWKLFDTFAPNWWMQRRTYVFRLGQEYDRKLPTHYILEPVDAIPDMELDGNAPAGARQALAAGDLAPGTIVGLKNFSHGQPRADGRSLSLAGEPTGGHPPLRVRWLGPTLAVHPVGRVKTTRWAILEETCAGFDRYGYADPLEKLPALLNERVNGTQSLIHGDLNVENVLVGPGEWVWLIDFAETRDGHTLYDFAHLYAELIAHVVAQKVSHPPDFLNIIEGNGDLLLATVREMAYRCLFDPRQVREFDLSLAVSCLGALKFANLNAHSRHLLYLTAAHLVQSL